MYRRSRFDPVSRYDEPIPHQFRELAERRVGGMVEEFNWQQTFSGALPGAPPRTTLLDLVVSAYIQGANDVIATAATRGLFKGGD